jgi:hypothetical protein
MLTTVGIRALRPAAPPYKVADSDGLFIPITLIATVPKSTRDRVI